MLKLYTHELSGNCYKVRLLLSLLGLEYEMIPVDLGKDEHKTPEFLKLNSFGQVPVIIDDNAIVSDSQGILVYLARRYGAENWLPISAEEIDLLHNSQNVNLKKMSFIGSYEISRSTKFNNK